MPKSKSSTPSYPSPPLLCVDASYLLFYRLNALKTWYNHQRSHALQRATDDKATPSPTKTDIPPPLDDTILRSELFRNKLCDRLDATLHEWIKRHRPRVVLLAFDGHHNWRKQVYRNYKSTRQHASATLELFRCGEAHLKRVYGQSSGHSSEKSTTVSANTPLVLTYQPPQPPPPPPKSRKRPLPPAPRFVLAHHDALEADDLVHRVTRATMQPMASTSSLPPAPPTVIIMANDHDYLPLLEYPNVHLIRLPNAPVTMPVMDKNAPECTPQEFLQMKLLLGDKSDNIGPVFVKPHALSKKKALALLRLSPNALQHALDESDEATRARWARNQQLIDNRYVPEELGEWMEEVVKVVH